MTSSKYTHFEDGGRIDGKLASATSGLDATAEKEAERRFPLPTGLYIDNSPLGVESRVVKRERRAFLAGSSFERDRQNAIAAEIGEALAKMQGVPATEIVRELAEAQAWCNDVTHGVAALLDMHLSIDFPDGITAVKLLRAIEEDRDEAFRQAEVAENRLAAEMAEVVRAVDALVPFVWAYAEDNDNDSAAVAANQAETLAACLRSAPSEGAFSFTVNPQWPKSPETMRALGALAEAAKRRLDNETPSEPKIGGDAHDDYEGDIDPAVVAELQARADKYLSGETLVEPVAQAPVAEAGAAIQCPFCEKGRLDDSNKTRCPNCGKTVGLGDLLERYPFYRGRAGSPAAPTSPSPPEGALSHTRTICDHTNTVAVPRETLEEWHAMLFDSAAEIDRLLQ